MLKIPSVQNLVNAAMHTLKRFPLVLLCAFIGAAVSIYLVDRSSSELEFEVHLVHLLITASLGLTLFLSVAMFTESKALDTTMKLILNGCALALLVIYYLTLPSKFEQIEVYRYLLFNTGLHLLVSFSPFIGQSNINGFWQFNKTFFL